MMSPQLNGMQNLAEMETGIPSLELIGISHMLKSYLSDPRHNSVTKAEGVLPLVGSGYQKYI